MVKNLNPIEEKMGENLEGSGTGKKLLKKTFVAQTLKLKMDKWNIMKLEIF